MSNQKRFALIGALQSDFAIEAYQDAVGSILVDSAEINFTYTDATPSITAALINASIVFARLQNADAASVLGRSANSSGVLDEIAAGANDRLLRRTSDALNFGQLTAGMFPNTVVPDAALSSNVPLLNVLNTFTDLNTFTFSRTNAKATLLLSANAPALRWVELDQGTDEKQWEIYPASKVLSFVINDDGGGLLATWGAVTRTSAAVTLINFLASEIQLDAALLDFNGAMELSGLAQFGAQASQSAAMISARNPALGNSFEWGHANTGGYAHTVGHEVGSGHGFLAFHAEAGTNSNTYRTRGIPGYIIKSDASGGISFARATNSSADNQSLATADVTISSAGIVTLGYALIGGAAIRLKGYAVAGLPAGTIGDTAYVTDALAPVFGAAVAAGGAVMVPVYYTGAAWFVG